MGIVLVMFKSDGQRKDFPVSGPITTLGRAEDCDLRVPLLSVSRRHCELSVSAEGLKAKDLGSSNGTYLNNKRISEETVLKAGDRLAVGPVVFTVQVDGQPEEIQPVKTKGQRMAEGDRAEGDRAEGDRAEGDRAEKETAPVAADAGGAGPQDEQPKEQEGQEEAVLEAVTEPSGTEEEIDPISALEALAEQSDQDAEKKPPSQ